MSNSNRSFQQENSRSHEITAVQKVQALKEYFHVGRFSIGPFEGTAFDQTDIEIFLKAYQDNELPLDLKQSYEHERIMAQIEKDCILYKETGALPLYVIHVFDYRITQGVTRRIPRL